MAHMDELSCEHRGERRAEPPEDEGDQGPGTRDQGPGTREPPEDEGGQGGRQHMEGGSTVLAWC